MKGLITHKTRTGTYLLGAKSTYLFVMSIRLSAYINVALTTWTSATFQTRDFHEKSVDKCQIWLESNKNIGHIR